MQLKQQMRGSLFVGAATGRLLPSALVLLLALSNSWQALGVAESADGPTKIPANHSNHHDHDHHQQQQHTKASHDQCRPILNFALPQAVERQQHSTGSQRTSSLDRSQDAAGPAQKLSQSIPNSFSFSIGDINLPLTYADNNNGGGGGSSHGGAVQAAMKLLAAFDAQIYGDENEAGEGQRESGLQNVIRFKRNRLHLAGLNFTMMNMHLYLDAEPRFAIGVNIENTTLVGAFQYDGFAPTSLMGADYSKLAGHYRMSIDNLLLTASLNLTKVPTSGSPFTNTNEQTSQTPHRYTLASNDLRMNISNLGYITIEILDATDSSRPTSNYVLKMLQRVLQKTIKRTYNKFEDYIRDTLESEGRRFLDCELTRFSPLLTENQLLLAVNPPKNGSNSHSNSTKSPAAPNNERKPLNGTYLDDLAKIISLEIANSRLDRLPLPNFDYQRSVFGSQADISFQNGSLDGLSHVRLNGETRVKLLEEHLIVNASIGWFDLKPHYNWTLYFGGPAHLESDRRQSELRGTESAATNSSFAQLDAKTAGRPARPMAGGFVSFTIKTIDFDAVISKSVRSHSRMTVDELVIRRLDNPKMDIGGLPGMNRLTRAAVNFFMGRLKQRLVSSIQPSLKQELEHALNRLALFN